MERLVLANGQKLDDLIYRVDAAVEQNVVLAEIEYIAGAVRVLSEAMRITSGMIPQLVKRGDTRPLLVKSQQVQEMLNELEQGTSLSRFMERAFSEDELAGLLMDLSRETLEDFPGETRNRKIIEIVLAYQRRGELERLETAVRKARPNARF